MACPVSLPFQQVWPCWFRRSGEWPRPPFDPCGAVSTIAPNYVADWCGKHAPGGYEEFRKALDDYRGSVFDFSTTHAAVALDLVSLNCATSPVDPQEVELIIERLSFSGRPALDRAGAAWNRLKAAHKQAFAGDPQATAVADDIDALNRVIEDLGRSKTLLESTQDLWVACNSAETYQAASAATQSAQDLEIDAGAESMRLTGAIQMAFQSTQDACSAVKVRERLPANQIEKSGDRKTSKSGGAGLTYPKTLDVGKKPKRLPVNVTSPGTGYGTITVTRGSKGIVATGGWVEPGTFGLLMTVPAKTKTGKVTLTFSLEGGATVKGTVRLR